MQRPPREFGPEAFGAVCACGQPSYNHSMYNDGCFARRPYCQSYRVRPFVALELVEQPQRSGDGAAVDLPPASGTGIGF